MNLVSEVRLIVLPIWRCVNESSGPFNHEVTQVLRIINNNAGSVAFKVHCLYDKYTQFTNMYMYRSRLQHPNSRVYSLAVNRNTDPSRYCVRPNSGLVKAGSAVDVQGIDTTDRSLAQEFTNPSQCSSKP